MFADTARITIKSGNGGDGHVSFRRELYVPNGGPDGGDGGRGGDLIFEVDKGMDTLSDFRIKKTYAAGNGAPGGGKRCHGKDGADLVVKVPYGTVVREAESGRVITDMSGNNLREIVLKGGRGGLGNMHFATSSMQAPRFAQPGKPGLSVEVSLELKVIADVGLIGFPNVGKSTLISMSSNARPEIANYHFTTLRPHLGVVRLDDETSFVMADIPGLIEGASDGVGLGHDFLRHIQRCRVLIHVVDAAGTEGRDPVEDIEKINRELFKFDPELCSLPVIIAANKMDCFINDGTKANPCDIIKEHFGTNGVKVMPVSAATGMGVKKLLYETAALLKTASPDTRIYQKDYDPAENGKKELPVDIYKEASHVYAAEGPRIDRMLGYTRLDTERGFDFFQKFMKEQGIIDEMKKLGLTEGDTVKVGGIEFEYYD